MPIKEQMPPGMMEQFQQYEFADFINNYMDFELDLILGIENTTP